MRAMISSIKVDLEVLLETSAEVSRHVQLLQYEINRQVSTIQKLQADLHTARRQIERKGKEIRTVKDQNRQLTCSAPNLRKEIHLLRVAAASSLDVNDEQNQAVMASNDRSNGDGRSDA